MRCFSRDSSRHPIFLNNRYPRMAHLKASSDPPQPFVNVVNPTYCQQQNVHSIPLNRPNQKSPATFSAKPWSSPQKNDALLGVRVLSGREIFRSVGADGGGRGGRRVEDGVRREVSVDEGASRANGVGRGSAVDDGGGKGGRGSYNGVMEKVLNCSVDLETSVEANSKKPDSNTTHSQNNRAYERILGTSNHSLAPVNKDAARKNLDSTHDTYTFLDASQHLYNPLCMSVRRSEQSKFEIGNKVNNGQILS